MNLNSPIDLKPLNPLNAVKAADILFRKDKRVEVFLGVAPEKRAELLRSLTPKVRREILQKAPIDDVVTLLETLDPDEATDYLQTLTKGRRERVLQLLNADLKGSLSTLLEFDPQTAAGLMTLDYIQCEVTETIEDVAKKFRVHEKRTGRPPVILATKEDKLAGFLPGHELGLVSKEETIDKYVKRIPSISYAAKHAEVMKMFSRHAHSKVAVVNDTGMVIGMIYSDDVLKLLQEQQGHSLYDFAGISNEETVSDSTRQKVRNRYKWLIINLGTTFIAAFTISAFENTLDKFVLLAIYMPIVAGMGGNAATQTLAVLVRGISLNQIDLKTSLRTLKNELGAGFINGAINAVIVAAVVIVINRDFKIALILAMAMIINLLVAAFFGTLVPLIMSRLGKDPAASATIFITTATDVFGFLVFLGLATLILS